MIGRVFEERGAQWWVFTASRVQSTCGGRLTPHFLCPQAYYAIDLVRTTFETGAYMMNHSDECLFKDASGVPVPRPVYGFDGGAGSCGVEKWLEGC